MKLEKVFIKNKKNQNISVQIEKSNNQKGLVFVMHGLGGRKNQEHIRSICEVFIKQNITVISFDTTNSFGESDGKFEDATLTNYFQDLQSVILWSENQDFYQEPFFLAGHSIGGICILLYSQQHPDKIKALAPISTVITGKMTLETKQEGDLEKWKKEGIREWRGNSGNIKRLKWAHIEDRLKYDALKEINKITMPTILIVGENDTSTPVNQQQILFNNLKTTKEIHIISNADHNFRGGDEKANLNELKTILENWIKKLK